MKLDNYADIYIVTTAQVQFAIWCSVDNHIFSTQILTQPVTAATTTTTKTLGLKEEKSYMKCDTNPQFSQVKVFVIFFPGFRTSTICSCYWIKCGFNHYHHMLTTIKSVSQNGRVAQ